MTARRVEPPTFVRESDLCAAFIEAVEAGDGSFYREPPTWRCFAETEGWDILLARDSDGAQIGVQAKLRLNNKVVAQALADGHWWASEGPDPDYRAILVPRGQVAGDLIPICDALGITIIRFGRDRYQVGSFAPTFPDERFSREIRSWHQWAPARRHALPDYVPDVVAGAPAPLKLTHWKIAAIRLAIVLEERPLTRADFKAVGISPTRWTVPYSGWLVSLGRGKGYVAGPHLPDFKAQHPVNYEQIRADRAKWDWAKKLTSLLSEVAA